MSTDLDQGGRIPQTIKTYVGPSIGWKLTDSPVDIEFIIDGGGQTPQPGYKGHLLIPDWVYINNWILLSEVSGSCVIDVWKIPLSTFLAGTAPAVTNSICGGNLPSLSNQVARQGTNISGWTTLISQNDIVGFNLNSVSTLLRVTVILQCVRIIGPS